MGAEHTNREKYFTGKPCKNGHIAYRNSISKRCVECLSNNWKRRVATNGKEAIYAVSKAWRDKNKELVNNLSRKTRIRNKEVIREQVRRRRIANPEKFKKQSLDYYYRNKESCLNKLKEYRQKNSSKIKSRVDKYYENKKSEYLARCRLRQTRLIQKTPLWADIDAIKDIYAERELISRETGILHHVDHIIPLQGKTVSGLHVENNLQIIPAKINLSKHAKYDENSVAE